MSSFVLRCLLPVLLLTTSQPADAQQVWRKFYGGSGSEGLGRITPTPDGGFLITGSTTSYGNANYSGQNGTANSPNTLIIKTDSLGIMQWQVVWDTLRSTSGSSAAVNAAGDYFITGHAETDSSLTDIFVLKLSPSGDVLWSRTYGGAFDESVTGIESAGNDLVVCGNTASYGQGQTDIYLFKIDSQGNQLWTKTIGSLVTEISYGFNKVHDGGFIICGAYQTASFRDGYVARTDATGDSIWTKIIPIGGSSICQYVSCTELMGDSVFAVVGRGGANYGTYFASRIGMNGQVINHFTQSGYLRYATWVTATNDGGFAVTGYPFTKFNYKAEVEWESGGLSSNFNTVKQLPDGFYILGAHRYGAYAPLNYDIEMAKTTEAGFSVTFPTVPVDEIPDQTHCKGDTVELITVPGFDHYQWYVTASQYVTIPVPQSNTNTIEVDSTGSRYCMLLEGNDLYHSESESVGYFNAINAQLNHTGTLNYCISDTTVTLSIPYTGNWIYQWYLDGNPIPGATTNSHSPAVPGNYHIVVTQTACGTVSSDTLIVNPFSPPMVEITPDTSYLGLHYPGTATCDTAHLTIPFHAGYQYRWYRDGVLLPVTSNSLHATQAGSYHAIVFNSCGYDTTESVVVLNDTISYEVTVTGPLSGCGPETTTLSVPYNYDYEYRWYRNGSTVSGFSSSYSPNTVGDYYCRIGIYCDNTFMQYFFSDTISYNYVKKSRPTVSFQGLAPTICANDSVRLNINGVSGATFYQWYVDSVPIPNTDTLVYWAKSTGYYQCIGFVPNCDSVPSHPFFVRQGLPEATLTVSDTIKCPNASLRIYLNTYDPIYTYGTAIWSLDGVVIPNATGSSHYTSQAGVYECTVGNLCGSTITNSITLYNESNLVTVTSSSGSNYYCKGDTVTLYATEIPGYTYQWYNSWNNDPIPGADSSSFIPTQNGNYYVKHFTGTCYFNTGFTINQVNAINANVWSDTPLESCGPGPVHLNANRRADLSYEWKVNGNIIPGASDEQYDASADGRYSIVITDSLGCDYQSPEVVVSLNALDDFAIYTHTGTTVACDGDSIVLYAGRNSPSFQWLMNFQPIPGATADSLIVYDAGFYSVQVQDGLGCSGMANIIIAESNFSSGGPTITHDYCQDSTGAISYYLGGLFHTFLWDNGATSHELTGLIAGTYSVTVTDHLGCTGNQVHTVLDLDSVPVSIGGALNKCAGSNSVIYPSTSYSTYLWSTGDTTHFINPQVSGVYTLSVTNANGCPGSDTATVTIFPLPVITIYPAGPTGICLGDSLKLSVDPGFSDHRWFRNGVLISNAYDSVYFAKSRGSYACRARDANGCYDTSAAVNVRIVCLPPQDPVDKAIADNPVNYWQVFPNPSSGDFTLSSPFGISGNEIIRVFDMAGQEVGFRKMNGNEDDVQISLARSGVYLVIVIDADLIQRFRVVKTE